MINKKDIEKWIHIYVSKSRKGTEPKFEYEPGSDYLLDFPDGFTLTAKSPETSEHIAYRREFNSFPPFVRINSCTDFFNVKNGGFLESVSGFPKNIEVKANSTFDFTVSSADFNVDYMIKCFQLARKWVMNTGIPVNFKFFMGSVLLSKYTSSSTVIDNSIVDDIDETWFVSHCIMKMESSDDTIKNKLSTAVNIYFKNRHSDTKLEYGRRNLGRTKKMDKSLVGTAPSSKYFPIIDVLMEVQKQMGKIDLRTTLSKSKTFTLFKFYAAKLFSNSPIYQKMFVNNHLFDGPNAFADFLLNPDFQTEIAEDPRGSKLVFNADRESRKEIHTAKTLRERKKELEDLGIYYSWDLGTIRGNKDMNNIWVVQTNEGDGTLSKPLFIEARNGNGAELISSYQSQLKYLYYCLTGRTLDDYLNARVRTFKTFCDNEYNVIDDNRRHNIGDIRNIVSKKN